ncbi:hypothetical protein BN136_187 [Cronobacter universalis NCTC 9529]|nr:hypothetical protein BN136_187 [Cronobacter universalis NCTC 9529]
MRSCATTASSCATISLSRGSFSCDSHPATLCSPAVRWRR